MLHCCMFPPIRKSCSIHSALTTEYCCLFAEFNGLFRIAVLWPSSYFNVLGFMHNTPLDTLMMRPCGGVKRPNHVTMIVNRDLICFIAIVRLHPCFTSLNYLMKLLVIKTMIIIIIVPGRTIGASSGTMTATTAFDSLQSELSCIRNPSPFSAGITTRVHHGKRRPIQTGTGDGVLAGSSARRTTGATGRGRPGRIPRR